MVERLEKKKRDLEERGKPATETDAKLREARLDLVYVLAMRRDKKYIPVRVNGRNLSQEDILRREEIRRGLVVTAEDTEAVEGDEFFTEDVENPVEFQEAVPEPDKKGKDTFVVKTWTAKKPGTKPTTEKPMKNKNLKREAHPQPRLKMPSSATYKRGGLVEFKGKRVTFDD